MEKDSQDLSKVLDIKAEELILEALKVEFPRIGIEKFIVLSEELGVLLFPTDSKCHELEPIYLILIDPMDNTDNALMAFGGAIAITTAFIGEGENAEIVAAVVGDLARNEMFWAYQGQGKAFVDYGNGYQQTEPLEPNYCVHWKKTKLSSFNAKLNRFFKFCLKKTLIEQLDQDDARILLHHGGPLPICRVAAGDIDAVIEFDKGYKAIDYSGGLFIASKAKAKVKFLGSGPRDASHLVIGNGASFKEKLLNTLTRRQRFICAANDDVRKYCEQFFSY